MKDCIKNIAMIKIQAFMVFCFNLLSFSFSTQLLEDFNLWLQLFLTSLQILIAIISAIILIRGKLFDLFKTDQSKSVLDQSDKITSNGIIKK